jgi:hypothetical protein
MLSKPLIKRQVEEAACEVVPCPASTQVNCEGNWFPFGYTACPACLSWADAEVAAKYACTPALHRGRV